MFPGFVVEAFLLDFATLLEVESDHRISPLERLKANPRNPSPDAMLALIDKLKTIEVIQDMKLDPEQILMDHNTEETIQVSRDGGFWCGHTVYPVTKLSPERASNIIDEYGTEKMMVNSSCDWGPSDPLSVPRDYRGRLRSPAPPPPLAPARRRARR